MARVEGVLVNEREGNRMKEQRTVQQVAERVGLSPRNLRFYDLNGIVCPERSGGGYRLYSPDDEEALRLTKLAREANLSLDQVRGVLASPRPKVALHAVLRTRVGELSRLMDRVAP